MTAVLAYLLAPVLIAYSGVMAVLFIYIFNMLYLAYLGARQRTGLQTKALQGLGRSPSVTVQLPIYNEYYVAERLLSACAQFDYPRELLEIQVLDDSTDETATLLAQKVAALRAEGLNAVHIHRSDRSGFKAGALANGLVCARGEYIAIFDADFVPSPDFLTRMLPYFNHERVAFVQARWGHLNHDYSLLTLLQSFSLDAHFAIDQLARSRAGFVFNFNGTAGIWRKSAVVDVGGWQADTLTEDMDLSYRAFLRGWSARYAGDVEAPAELPVSFTAYRRQQYRWARGSLECAIKYLPAIWRSEFSIPRKVQATLHLTGYLLHLLTVALMLLYPLLLLFAHQYPALLQPIGLGLLMNFLALAPALYFVIAQRLLRRRWLRAVPIIVFMSMFATGMVLNTLRAMVQILFQKSVPFERTPKFGITDRNQSWLGSRYQVRVDALVLLEILLGLFNLLTAGLAFELGYYLMMIYACLFAAGLFFCSGLTLAQTFSARFPPQPEPVSA
ncbi:MAG TPA: glycosyltransferase family 2 protein [Anaerolineales bacterium]|nr:glycosyltransferase family 2 protein [Anaerolineales bacterium]